MHQPFVDSVILASMGIVISVSLSVTTTECQFNADNSMWAWMAPLELFNL